MRRLIAAVLASTMLVAPASGQLATISPSELIQLGKAEIQSLKAYALQANQYISEAQSAASLATQVASTVAHPNLGSVAGLMSQVGIENPTGVDPYMMQSLLSGYSGAGIQGLLGKASLLGAMVNTSHENDAVYNCADRSFACVQSQQQGWGNAGLKGVSGRIYQELAAHIPILQGLRARALASTTPAERENVLLQLETERNWAQNAGLTLQSAVATAEAQDRVAHQQRGQKLMQDADALIAAARN